MSRMPTAEEIRLWRSVMAQPSRPAMVARPAPRATVLDLHGYTMQDAYHATIGFLRAIAAVERLVVIITGRSGQIRREFPAWLEPLPFIASCREVERGGAYRVMLKRIRASRP